MLDKWKYYTKNKLYIRATKKMLVICICADVLGDFTEINN